VKDNKKEEIDLNKNENPKEEENIKIEKIKVHTIIILEFKELLIDMPFAILLLTLLWRLPFLASKLMKTEIDKVIL
jgi:hypothetical protein